MAKRANRSDRHKRKQRRVGRYVLFAVAVVIFCTVIFWRTPALELRDGNTSYFINLDNERQFALAWERGSSEQRATRVMMLEAASDGLTVIGDRDDIKDDAATAVVEGNVLQIRMADQFNPLLIYGGGQLLLTTWFEDGSDVSLRFRNVSMVYLWLSGRYHH